MQLTRDTGATHFIRAFEAGRVRVGERWIDGNVIIGAQHIVEHWNVGAPEDLRLGDLDPAIALEPEIILLGTGAAMLLPDVDLMAALAERGIGLEIMSTPAACRTFNVLLQEQRRVVVALFNG